MSNRLSGFDEAPVYDRLPGFEIGTYLAEVIEMTKFQSSTEDGEYFKARFRILEAAPGSRNSPGDEVAEVLPLFGQWKKTFFGKVKSLIAAATLENSSKITYDDFDEATGPENPTAGTKVKVFAATTKKKNGEEYVRPTYVPYRPVAAGAEATAS